MSVSSSVVSLSRRGGRTSGQLSSPYGSRTPSDGDRVNEARIIVSEETTLGEKIGTTYPKIIFNFFFFSSTPHDIQAMSIERNLR